MPFKDPEQQRIYNKDYNARHRERINALARDRWHQGKWKRRIYAQKDRLSVELSDLSKTDKQ